MRIYLDNCCFNRPFDNQSGIRIKLETEAKLYIQERIRSGEMELTWSYIIDFENEANPFPERKEAIERWKSLSIQEVLEDEKVLIIAASLANAGIKPKDALHIACAIKSNCQYFLTTDDEIIKKGKDVKEIEIINPTDFIKIIG